MSLKIIISIAVFAFAIEGAQPATAQTPHVSVMAHIPLPGMPVISSDGQSIGVVASAPRGTSRAVRDQHGTATRVWRETHQCRHQQVHRGE